MAVSDLKYHWAFTEAIQSLRFKFGDTVLVRDGFVWHGTVERILVIREGEDVGTMYLIQCQDKKCIDCREERYHWKRDICVFDDKTTKSHEATLQTKKISGKDAELLHEILTRNGIALSDDQPAIRIWRRVDKGKRLFVRIDSQKPKIFDNDVDSA